MNHYNMLADVEVNDGLTAWCFKVKIHRAFPVDVFGEFYWNYILVDEAGSKIEMVICPVSQPSFEGLQQQEGKWVEIFRVQVLPQFGGFLSTESRFRLSVIRETRINLIPPLNDHHHMDFKAIHQIRHINNKNIPIDTMGVVFNTEPLQVCHTDPRRTRMVFYIRDNLENQIKCVIKGDNAYVLRDQLANAQTCGEVIVVLKMWRIWGYSAGDSVPWLQNEGFLSDWRFNPRMKEVDDFKEEVADPYESIYGPNV